MAGIDVEEGGGLVASAEGLQFRDLHPDDVPELMQLQSALFPVQYRKSFYDKLFAYGHYCLVGVTADGQIAAVASARVVEYDNSGDPLPRVQGYIMTLGVRESHRRLGIGSRALDEIMQLLRARTVCAEAVLHVKLANEAAVAFYERAGFERGAENGGLCRNHYLLDGRQWDALLFTRTLHQSFLERLRGYRQSLPGLCAIL